jgi:hypothetical protein
MKQVNVQFVYGAGPDNLYGGGLRWLQSEVKGQFGDKIYSPSIIDYTEYEKLVDRFASWNDPTILIGHSCGCNPITFIAHKFTRKIPFILCIAPSVFCPVATIPANVARVTQATSWWGDVFNLGGRLLARKAAGNTTSVIDEIKTGLGHVPAPYSNDVRSKLIAEIGRALA